VRYDEDVFAAFEFHDDGFEADDDVAVTGGRCYEDERSKTGVQVCQKSRDILTIHLHDIGSCTCPRLAPQSPRDILL